VSDVFVEELTIFVADLVDVGLKLVCDLLEFGVDLLGGFLNGLAHALTDVVLVEHGYEALVVVDILGDLIEICECEGGNVGPVSQL